MNRFLGVIYLAFGIGLSATAQEKKGVVAFPGAEGFGAYAIGGRGGKVYKVTNLDDRGPGSFREGCEADGPRTVVFEVAGNIELKSAIRINNGFLTVAGQTAPGDGVCLKNHPILISAHDVVIRYIRCRPGDVSSEEMDSISINRNCQDVIVDHCSASWGSDELISVSGTNIRNITVQWCFITESMNHSVHHKGDHGYGSLIRTDGPVTYHHNVYAHNKSRNPRPGSYGDPKATLLDFRNNVIYDWGERAGYSAEDPTSINYVGNYLKPGPSTKRHGEAFHVGGLATKLFVSGTYMVETNGVITDDWKLVSNWSVSNKVDKPFPAAAVKTETAQEAYQRILRDVGANVPVRDAVDQRVLREIAEGTGHIINSQKDVGGWPELKPGAAPVDTDGDGIPDAWESAHQLNPKDASDGKAISKGGGYSNLENYLNSLIPGGK